MRNDFTALASCDRASKDEDAAPRPYENVFVSDMHLGRENVRADLLLEFLQNIKTKRLVLCGDVFDIWKLGATGTLPDSHRLVMDEIQRKIAEENTEVICIVGNHDSDLRHSGILGKTVRNIQFMEYFDYEHNGIKYHVTHGDEFDSLIHRMGESVYSAMNSLGLIKPYDALQKAFHKLQSSVPGLKKAFNKSSQRLTWVGRGVSKLAGKVPYDFAICGHTHRPRAPRNLNGLWYANTGGWVVRATALCQRENEMPELVFWKEQRNHLAATNRLHPVDTQKLKPYRKETSLLFELRALCREPAGILSAVENAAETVAEAVESAIHPTCAKATTEIPEP